MRPRLLKLWGKQPKNADHNGMVCWPLIPEAKFAVHLAQLGLKRRPSVWVAPVIVYQLENEIKHR